MRKSVLAMAVVAIMATGCGSTEGTDAVNEQSSAVEQTSEQAAATEESSQVLIEEAEAEASVAATEEATGAATEEASKEASKELSNEASKDTSKETAKEAPAAATSSLKDGDYDTNLVPEPSKYFSSYVKSIEVTDNAVVLQGALSQRDTNTDFGYNTYTFPIDANTQFLSSGGEQAAKGMSKEEFSDYISSVIKSGLGLSIKIKNGCAVSFDIYS
ncbi:hypothetical protein [Butyrivibrio sp. LB2008]|uniref:hypothetical protein n=1 Tax=Butyrivibrio sp. LB2008 TaxID=1408305 RepID=UPI00047E631C|nr:hypothetical protein [Butyrivibrio sp. LB2008]